MNNSNQFFLAAGALGALAVILGAFGAHSLQAVIVDWYPEDFQKKLQSWNTAVEYQMYHALAIGMLGSATSLGRRWRFGAMCCFLLGILIFSGLLYCLVLTDVKILGAIVPVGGVLLIVGWVLVALAALVPSRNEVV